MIFPLTEMKEHIKINTIKLRTVKLMELAIKNKLAECEEYKTLALLFKDEKKDTAKFAAWKKNRDELTELLTVFQKLSYLMKSELPVYFRNRFSKREEYISFLENVLKNQIDECCNCVSNSKLLSGVVIDSNQPFANSKPANSKPATSKPARKEKERVVTAVIASSVVQSKPKKKTVLIHDATSRVVNFAKEENKLKSINIFYGRDICLEKGHNLEPVKALVPDICTKKQITLNVFYCKSCNKYRINNHGTEGFEMLMSKNIYPMVLLEQIYQPGKELKKHSLLNLYGYTVQKGVYTDAARQNILGSILDGKLLKKAYILDRLRYNIDYIGKGPNMGRAVIKWQDDYNFVSNYRINQQKKVNGRIVNAR